MRTAAHDQHRTAPAWEDSFLAWFAGLGIPMSETPLRLGGLEYRLFSTLFETSDGRTCSCHGRAPDRKLAAVKCAAETIERRLMVQFFQEAKSTCPGSVVHLTPDRIEHGPANATQLPPRELWNSNGWAVHQNEEKAKESAFLEALERHLLLKSFFTFGWNGFKMVEKADTAEMRCLFLTSRFSSSGYIAGLVAAQSPLYPGVSFGYCIGKESEITESRFWEAGLFEAIDKILTLGGRSIDLSESPGSWLRAEAKWFLETPFDLGILGAASGAPIIEDSFASGYLKSFDLADKWNLEFPLHGAFVWSGSLIPLFHKPLLSGAAADYLGPILHRNGLSLVISERHPIL